MKSIRLFILTLIVTNLIGCKSHKIVQLKLDPMHVYLCIGQSNMAGRATIEIIDKDTLTNVYLFTGKEKTPWENATNPFNKYSTIRKKIQMQRLSLSYNFSKEIAKASPNKRIGLVVNARGGTSIEEWKPRDTLYHHAISQTKKALKNGAILKGIIWHQGEVNTSSYKKYLKQLKTLISALRTDLKMPNIPFVAGQLSPDKTERNNFNEMLLKLPKYVKHTAVISSKNTTTIDKTHFDSKSQRLLGKRYAEAMLNLMKD